MYGIQVKTMRTMRSCIIRSRQLSLLLFLLLCGVFRCFVFSQQEKYKDKANPMDREIDSKRLRAKSEEEKEMKKYKNINGKTFFCLGL